jgi:hypothetical protein
VIHSVIVHLENDMPVLVDLEDMPGPADQILRCTNVRTIDGKRPAFVHDKRSTFLLPMKIVRLIEVPVLSESSAVATQDDDDVRTRAQQHEPEPEHEALDEIDEEAEEDLLARIRSI